MEWIQTEKRENTCRFYFKSFQINATFLSLSLCHWLTDNLRPINGYCDDSYRTKLD